MHARLLMQTVHVVPLKALEIARSTLVWAHRRSFCTSSSAAGGSSDAFSPRRVLMRSSFAATVARMISRSSFAVSASPCNCCARRCQYKLWSATGSSVSNNVSRFFCSMSMNSKRRFMRFNCTLVDANIPSAMLPPRRRSAVVVISGGVSVSSSSMFVSSSTLSLSLLWVSSLWVVSSSTSEIVVGFETCWVVDTPFRSKVFTSSVDNRFELEL